MKTPFLILGLICSVLGIAIGTIGPPPESPSFGSEVDIVVAYAQPVEHRYENKDYGFSIDHPNNWRVDGITTAGVRWY